MRGHGDRGAVVVEFLGVAVLALLALLAVAQLAVWCWARDVAASAAHEGARTAAEAGRPLEDGTARARAVLRDGIGGASDRFDVVAEQDGGTVAVRAEGEAPALVPFLPPFPIRATGHALDEDTVLP